MIEVGLLSEIFCLTAGLLSCVISPTEWTAPTASSFYCREGIICLSIHAVQHNKIKKREKKRHRELNMQKGNLCFKPGIDIQAVWSNNSWPFSYKIGNAYLCCVILSLSPSFISFAFVSPLHRPPCLWWISIMARSPFIQLISLLFYSNCSTSTLLWYTYWQPESSPNKSNKNVGNVTGSPLIWVTELAASLHGLGNGLIITTACSGDSGRDFYCRSSYSTNSLAMNIPWHLYLSI